jgi:hypothetical protein
MAPIPFILFCIFIHRKIFSLISLSFNIIKNINAI